MLDFDQGEDIVNPEALGGQGVTRWVARAQAGGHGAAAARPPCKLGGAMHRQRMT